MGVHIFDHLLATYGAGLVGLIVGLEAMGLPLPGESLIIAGAIYCATTHKVSIVWMLLAAIAGAIVGDNLGYLIGRSLGFRLLVRYGRRIGLTEERLLFGRLLFQRYGSVIVFAARFVAVLRTFAALLAGANRMSWWRFLFWNALGGTVWVGGYGFAAYLIGAEIRHLEGPIGIGIGVIVAVLVIVATIYLKTNEKQLMEEAKRRSVGERDV